MGIAGSFRIVMTLAVVLAGCGGSARDQVAGAPATPASPAGEAGAGTPRPPDDGATLAPPFTADAIREIWVEGLTLEILQRTPQGEELQRWRVTASDAAGCTIEYTVLGADGEPRAEATAQRATWEELRDHASYPAATASRRRARITTALGELDGWLYEVRDPGAGSVSEVFFAEALPGAPVRMTTVREADGELLFSMEQVSRRAPQGVAGS